MKIFEITEAKEEMCSEACCGKPITECKCGPDCEHCDCHAKNKKVDEGYKSKLRKKAKHAGRRSGRRSNKKLRDEFQDTGIANEASTIPPMKKELDNLIRNVMSPEDGKRAFYIYVALNKAANSNVIDGSVIAYRKKLNALIQKYNSGGKKGGIFKPGAKSVQVPFDRKRKDLGGNAGVSETATVGGTSAGDVSVITSVPGAKRKVGKGKNGLPKAPQATNADGTAKNALDMTANVMGGKAIKR